MPPNPDVRLRIIAENLARAALQEAKRDVEQVGTAARGASTSFGRMVFSNGQLIASSATARRGLNVLETGLRSLAVHATGVSGPVGNIARGFGMLGLSSLTVTGALAAVGAVALGYQLLTSDLHKATKSMADFTKGLNESARGSGPGQQFKRLLEETNTQLATLETRFIGIRGALQATPGGAALFGDLVDVLERRERTKAETAGVDAVLALRGARARENERFVRTLVQERDLLNAGAEARFRVELRAKGITGALEQEALAAFRLNEELKRLGVSLRELGLAQRLAPRLAAGLAGVGVADTADPRIGLRGVTDPRQLGRARLVETAGALPGSREVRIQFERAGVAQGVSVPGGTQAGGPGSPIATAQMVAMFANLASGLVAGGGGGIGGFLQSAGGFLGLAKGVNPIIGAVVGGLGSVFSAFDRSEDKRHRELVRAVNRIAEERGLQRVTQIFVGAGSNLRETLRDLEDHDAVTRVSTTPGATG